MNILTVFIHYPVCSGRYVTDALKRLGHTVRHIGDSTGNHIWGGQVDARHAYASDGGYTAHWDDWRPDLVLLLDSAFAYHHPVYADVPHVVYGMDNHVRDYRQPGMAHYFLAHKAVSIMDWQDDMTWLPCGYDPVVFTPSPIPWAEREYDVALVGVLYPGRVAALEALQKAGLKVFAATGLLYEDYAAAYHNARVSLCISAAGDLAQRVFETAACGCEVVSDQIMDLQDQEAEGFWKRPAEIAQCDDIDFMVKKAKEMSQDPEFPFAGAAALWAKNQTWDKRVRVIIDWLQAPTATDAPAEKPKQRRRKRGE